ncbi:MAG: GIY-YIG nuclease family protein [Candidatus Bathyarchaeia archaeon]
MPYYVYILLCEDGSYYTGYTRDAESRFEQHKRGLGARYTMMRRPLRIVYMEEVESRGEAVKRELEIKSLSHEEKGELVGSSDGEEM